MGIWEGVKRGSKALIEGDPPARYLAGGRPVFCEHCHSDVFHEGEAQLNTAGVTFLQLDWANKCATTLMCNTCGRIHWYGIKPERQ